VDTSSFRGRTLHVVYNEDSERVLIYGGATGNRQQLAQRQQDRNEMCLYIESGVVVFIEGVGLYVVRNSVYMLPCFWSEILVFAALGLGRY